MQHALKQWTAAACMHADLECTQPLWRGVCIKCMSSMGKHRNDTYKRRRIPAQHISWGHHVVLRYKVNETPVVTSNTGSCFLIASI